MKRQNIKKRLIILLSVLILSVVGICFRTPQTLIFFGGFFVGVLCLMVLRVFLWNTSEFIKDRK